MDLRRFYQELRATEEKIADEHVIVISKETADGGKAGVRTEVTRATAARLLVENRARLATPEEVDAYRALLVQEKQAIEAALAAARLQLNVISDADLRSLRDRLKPGKG